MSYIKKSVGETFRSIRKSKNMTQMDVAEKAGLGHNFISLLERGNKNSSINSLELLSDAVDCLLRIEFIDKKQEKLTIDKPVFVFKTPNKKFELKVVDIRLSENNLLMSTSDQRFEGVINRSCGSNIKMLDGNYKNQQLLLSSILNSGVLEEYQKSRDKWISICFEASVDEKLFAEATDTLACSLACSYAGNSLFGQIFSTPKTIEIKIYDSITNEKIDKAFKTAFEKYEEKRLSIVRYLNDHPNGFPYICCLDFDLCSEHLTLYKENASSSLFSLYYAWNCKDATNKFVEDVYSIYDEYYFNDEFVNHFAALLYNGDIFDIEELNTIDSLENLINNLLSLVILEENESGSYTIRTEFDEFQDLVRKTYTKEQLKGIIGVNLYTMLLKIWVYDNAIVKLDKKTEKIFKL